jgi:hypothetical protein
METAYKNLNDPSFDINTFKTNNQQINDSLTDVLNESSKQNNQMANIVYNADKEIEKYKTILDIKDDNLSITLNNIQWNNYYYKRYKKLNEILRVYIVVCIILIIIAKLQSPYFDNLSYTLISGTILSLLFVYILYSLWDVFIRDNINFDEYDFTYYGTGVPSNYNPTDSSLNIYIKKPELPTYDFSACLSYINRDTSQTASSVESFVSSIQPPVSSIQPSVSSIQPSVSSIQPSVSSIQPSTLGTSQSPLF